jgi:mannose-6-phosphate isomerase
VSLEGAPRTLHVEESLQSIDFGDFEPSTIPHGTEELVKCEFFRVEEWQLKAARASEGCAVFCVAAGRVECCGRRFSRGEFFLLPATLGQCEISPGDAVVLRTSFPG